MIKWLKRKLFPPPRPAQRRSDVPMIIIPESFMVYKAPRVVYVKHPNGVCSFAFHMVAFKDKEHTQMVYLDPDPVVIMSTSVKGLLAQVDSLLDAIDAPFLPATDDLGHK